MPQHQLIDTSAWDGASHTLHQQINQSLARQRVGQPHRTSMTRGPHTLQPSSSDTRHFCTFHLAGKHGRWIIRRTLRTLNFSSSCLALINAKSAEKFTHHQPANIVERYFMTKMKYSQNRNTQMSKNRSKPRPPQHPPWRRLFPFSWT